jgi:spore photoproduct lyase
MKMPRFLSVEKGLENSAVGNKLKNAGEKLQVLDSHSPVDGYREGKRYLHLTSKRGETMHPCASMSAEYICCNVQVLETVSNCLSDCSYCFLQNYLNDGRIKVVGDTDAVIKEVKEKTEAEPWRFFRIGTWELGDSLVLETLTGTASLLVEAFASIPNVVLELKTKSDDVNGLLDLNHGGRTVIGWSLNPQAVISSEEHGTADLDSRLKAMERVVKAGYLVSLHFDPMIIHNGWEHGYENLISQVSQAVPAESIAWISVGSLRFNPEMKKTIEDNFPASRITSAEMILGDDGKMRYVKPLRLGLYHLIYNAIQKHLNKDIMTYLCMERWDVWKRIFGCSPRSSGHLDYIFTASLYKRFPKLVHQAPDLSLYDPQT